MPLLPLQAAVHCSVAPCALAALATHCLLLCGTLHAAAVVVVAGLRDRQAAEYRAGFM